VNQLERGILFATTVHSGQKDKSGYTYILHPLAVMCMVQAQYAGQEQDIPDGVTLEELLLGAVLHDTVEDCEVSLDEIETRFGLVVRNLVDALTRREGEKYFDFVRRTLLNPAAVIIKRADIAHNMSRTANLPPSEQGMIHRYEKALKILHGELKGDLWKKKKN